MKILTSEQVLAIDKETLASQYISSFKLMERATTKVFDKIKDRYKLYQTSFVIFCGKGNNGGDGLALARLLKEGGAFVRVYVLQSKKYSPDNAQNQDLLEERDIAIEKFTPKSKFKIKPDDIIIDALFGIGLTDVLGDEWSDFFTFINNVACFDRVSIDMPSGLFADVQTPKSANVFKADIVYTFQLPKLALLLPESKDYVKEFEVVDINLDADAIAKAMTTSYFVDKERVKSVVKLGTKFDHKGNFGHTLLIGGSYGKVGAMVLASKAAMKSGSGLVTAYIPFCGYTILQSAVPEVMCMVGDDEKQIVSFPATESYNAIGVGCGIGTSKETSDAFVAFLKSAKDSKLVIDADGLNIISEQKCLDKVPAQAILTPHIKELSRLIGTWEDDFDKITKVKEIAKKRNLIFVVKGAHTMVVTPSEDVYFNSTGNWGMATAGSGDTLTGIITSLLGQGYTAEDAAILGVYLHGLAGDCAIETIHPYSLIASDISNNISTAYKRLFE